MRSITYLNGQRMPNTRLTYVQEVQRANPKRRRAEFLCDCGQTVVTDLAWVVHLNTTSCGCVRSEQVATRNTVHGQAQRGMASGAYRSWQAMHQRVTTNPLYVNRIICPRWCGDDGFANFYADMGDRPPGMSIERIDNDGIYEPSNCKWATATEQNRNKSNTRKLLP